MGSRQALAGDRKPRPYIRKHMLDIQNSLAHPLVIRREDYTPPEWLVPETKLDFDLDPSTTRVTATLSVTRNGDHAAPLRHTLQQVLKACLEFANARSAA